MYCSIIQYMSIPCTLYTSDCHELYNCMFWSGDLSDTDGHTVDTLYIDGHTADTTHTHSDQGLISELTPHRVTSP